MSAPNLTTTDADSFTTAPSARRRWLLPSLLLGVAVLVGAFLIGFQTADGTAEASAEVSDAPLQEGELISFSDAFAKRAGISSEPVTAARLEPFVTVTGTLTYNPHHFAAIGARLQGRIRRVFKYDGDAVKQGEVLVEIESAELGRAQAHVLATRAKEHASHADAKREQSLAEQKISSQREAEFARANYEAARAERIAAERTLAALGGMVQADPGVLVLRSPIAGHVISTSASVGETVDPTKTLFKVAELSSLWIVLPVFEREVPGVQRGNAVEVRATGVHEKIDGTVDHVGQNIDLDTRTAPIRVVVTNEHGWLRPGQSVVARIHTNASTAQTPSIPRAALTRIDGKPMVFVMRDENSVEPRSVTVDSEDARRVAISHGLALGERVVVGGMFALKSELFR